jgi:hypothetical protein
MSTGPVIIVRPPKLEALSVSTDLMDKALQADIGPWATRSTVTLPIAIPQQLAVADSTRRRIGFASRNAGAIIDTIPPDPFGTSGILIPSSGILWIKENDGAQLVTFDWWAVNPGGVPFDVTVYQLFNW